MDGGKLHPCYSHIKGRGKDPRSLILQPPCSRNSHKNLDKLT